MKPHIAIICTVANLFAIACLVYLNHAANLRADHYKLLFEDASSIVTQQSHAIDNAQVSLAQADSVLSTCIEIVRTR